MVKQLQRRSILFQPHCPAEALRTQNPSWFHNTRARPAWEELSPATGTFQSQSKHKQKKRVKEKETRSQWVEKHSFSYSIKPFFKNTNSFQVKHAIRAAKITPWIKSNPIIQESKYKIINKYYFNNKIENSNNKCAVRTFKANSKYWQGQKIIRKE